MKSKALFICLMLFVLLIAFITVRDKRADEEFIPIPTQTPISNIKTTKEQLCTDNGGNYLSQYNECEGLTKKSCEENGGNFNECDSVCRHESDKNKPCILLCIAVCRF